MYITYDFILGRHFCGHNAIFILFLFALFSFFNRIYNKILNCDWFSARVLSRNQRAITWVSNYSYLIRTFCNWIPIFGYSRDFHVNRPRSIYQYSNMALRLSGQTPIFGVVVFVSKSLLGIEGQKK